MKVAIFGYSGHAYVIIDSILRSNSSVIGYFTKNTVSNNLYDIPYLGYEDNKSDLLKIKGNKYFVAIGNNIIREKVSKRISETLGRPTIVVDPSSNISDKTKIGYGTYVGKGAILNPNSQIGIGCIINSGAIIEHDCTIGNYSHASPGSVLCGNVSIGDYTLIGANSTIIPNINVGSNCLIGAGSVVIADVPDNTKLVGNPAR